MMQVAEKQTSGQLILAAVGSNQGRLKAPHVLDLWGSNPAYGVAQSTSVEAKRHDLFGGRWLQAATKAKLLLQYTRLIKPSEGNTLSSDTVHVS
ncbi:hypothetical protein E2C01_082938 [Portunus trituberculatus]|uniref:Uncharacterized protein n=1 Tax=Portunus trituberculatus TaxID=210409 RepID=A0A5B7J535_PORTR|nr:hypothetical protein [Portunus trituberculatus]